MNTSENLDYRKIAEELGLKMPDLIIVCDHCKCASCWAGIFLCSDYNHAGTEEMTVGELCEYHLEHPSYWLDNKADSF